jgi:hypothetical protein
MPTGHFAALEIPGEITRLIEAFVADKGRVAAMQVHHPQKAKDAYANAGNPLRAMAELSPALPVLPL